MFQTQFQQLLTKYMRRIRASNNDVAQEIDVNRGTIALWIKGSMPKNRDKILACAEYLRLTEEETDGFLEAAGFSKEYDMSGELAKEIFVNEIPDILIKLWNSRPPVMLLLTQTTYWYEPSFRNALLSQAKQQKYSPENVLHIQPPVSALVSTKDYFADLGKQCGMESIQNDYDFEKFLTNRVESSERLFLLVSRFEQGASSLGEQLASMIRNISETYPSRFHVMFLGGQKLAALKYGNGELSLLNCAEVEHWPELGRAEVRALWKYRFQELTEAVTELEEGLVDKLLEISGGHPQLLNKCLEFQRDHPDWELADYPEKLSHSDDIFQWFTPFATRKQPYRQRVCELLEKPDKLAIWQPYILDDVLRELYWKNLLVWREKNGQKGLYWRGEAIRMAGLEILRCQAD